MTCGRRWTIQLMQHSRRSNQSDYISAGSRSNPLKKGNIIEKIGRFLFKFFTLKLFIFRNNDYTRKMKVRIWEMFAFSLYAFFRTRVVTFLLIFNFFVFFYVFSFVLLCIDRVIDCRNSFAICLYLIIIEFF